MSASISVGPPPLRAFSTARPTRSVTAMMSLPSTCSPANPQPNAFWARVATADCEERGIEIAH